MESSVLREELELLRVNAQLAGARAEQVALHADDVADIEQLEEREIASRRPRPS